MDASQRLANLIVALRETRRGLTKQELMALVGVTDERMFQRDKDSLRDDLGLELTVIGPPGSQDVRYRLDQAAYQMPDLEFTAQEHTAIGLALQAWRGAEMESVAHMALTKLRALGVEAGSAGATAGLEAASPPAGVAVEPLVAAVLARQPVTFHYRTAKTGEVAQRRVEPWQVRKLSRAWYLAGFDLDRGEARMFRLSRVIGAITPLGEPGSFPEPDPALVAEAFRVAAAATGLATVTATAAAARVLRLEGATGPDDALHWPYHDDQLAAARLAGLAPHAVLTGPPALVAAVRDLLDGVAAVHAGEPSHPASSAAAGPAESDKPTRRRPTAPDRVARLLALVGYLDRVGSAPVSELAERFEVSRAQVLKDVYLLWTEVGRPGHAGGDLLDFIVSEDEQHVSLVDSQGLHVPLRLSRLEAAALVAALRALTDNPALSEAEGAAGALAKLTAALGAAPEPLAVALPPGPAEPAVLTLVRDAIVQGKVLAFAYVDTQGQASRRRVEPSRLFTDQDHWLLAAWDLGADGERYFRLDRMTDIQVTDQDSGHHRVEVHQSGYSGVAAYVVQAVFGPAARWRAENLELLSPAEELPGGGLRARLGARSLDWITALALEGGGQVEVESPAEVRAAVGERAAAALAAYQAGRPL